MKHSNAGPDSEDGDALTLETLAGEILSLREDLDNWNVGISPEHSLSSNVGQQDPVVGQG